MAIRGTACFFIQGKGFQALLSQKQKVFAILLGTIFSDLLFYGMIIPILPVYAKNLGGTEAQIGRLMATFPLVTLLAMAPFGLLADRLGKKPFIILGMFCLGLASLLYTVASSLLTLTLTRALQGLGASSNWVAALALFNSYVDEEKRGFELSLVTVAIGMGTILGPFVGGVGTPKTPFYMSSLLCFTLMVMALFSLREKGNVSIPRVESMRTKIQDTKKNIAALLKKNNVHAASFAACIAFLGMGMLETLFPLHVNAVMSSRKVVAFLFTVSGLFTVLVQPFVGRWSDKIGRIRPILCGLILMAILLPLPLFFTTVIPWAGVFILFGAAFGAAFTPTLPLIADEVGNEHQGLAYGFYNSVMCIGLLLGPWLGGQMAGWWGLREPFLLASVFTLLSVWGIFKMSK